MGVIECEVASSNPAFGSVLVFVEILTAKKPYADSLCSLIYVFADLLSSIKFLGLATINKLMSQSNQRQTFFNE